jgi:hypothetical protein
MTYKSKVSIIAALTVLNLAAVPLRAHAQANPGSGDVSNTVVSSLNLQDVDVRDAVRALFKNVNASYVVSADVQGTVTVDLKNVKFEVALRNILDQVKATFRIEASVYNIIKRDEPVRDPGVIVDPGPTLPKNTPVRIFLNHADPALIVRLLAGQGTNTNLLPEMSTITNGSMFGGSGGSGFGGGGNRGGTGGTGGNGFGGSNFGGSSGSGSGSGANGGNGGFGRG